MENFEKLNFIVGVNGSGKSRYLNRLAEFFDSRDNNVLEISNTVFDRFYFCSNNIKKLKMEEIFFLNPC